MADWTLLIHGGAGGMARGTLTPEQDAAARAGLNQALAAGGAVLSAGGAALDAVEAAVAALEDHPAFNAGRGAVLTQEGAVSLDAAIMRGDTHGGAVAGVTATRNPVKLARAVMEDGKHVFLAGTGADAFSAAHGLAQADDAWFVLPDRRRQLAELQARGGAAFDVEMKYGTVGAVACDMRGRVAAATSTGGVTGKRWGRVGDSPVLGAGTWADDRACAVSCTGSGETFLRVGAAHAIAARIRHLGEDAAVATEAVLAEVTALGGTGGIIVVTPGGGSATRFSTEAMFRGAASSAEPATIAIYGDELGASDAAREARVMLIRLLALVLALTAAAPASAYWEYGHETVAKIAWANVRPATRVAIRRLLAKQALLGTPECPARTIEQASYWPDCVKPLKTADGASRFGYAYSWHYQNVDICKPFDLTPACKDGDCVSAQIDRQAAILGNRRAPARERVMALAFLTHFVGDIHQPLHAGDKGDKGGNDAKAGYGIYTTSRLNLHSIWDGLLAERAISSPPSLVRRYPPAMRRRLAAGSVTDWSREGWQVARTAYDAATGGQACAPYPERGALDEATIERLVPVARDEVKKGGLRLARLLDRALS